MEPAEALAAENSPLTMKHAKANSSNEGDKVKGRSQALKIGAWTLIKCIVEGRAPPAGLQDR